MTPRTTLRERIERAIDDVSIANGDRRDDRSNETINAILVAARAHFRALLDLAVERDEMTREEASSTWTACS